MNGRNTEEGAGCITPASLLHTQCVGNMWPCQSEHWGMDRIGDKSCLVTIDTGASVTVARLDITTGMPERDLTMLWVLQVALGDPSHPEGSCNKTVSWASPTDDLGVRHRNCRWIQPGTGCLEDPRCVHGFGVPCALNRQWRSAIVAYQGQLSGGRNSVWQSCSSAAGRLLETVDSLAGMGSRATHQAGVYIGWECRSNPQKEVLVTAAGDCRSWKHTKGGAS
jgi:hypothetical protein